ncbi:MAG: hypothetical protein AB7P69_18805 [Candidatus Binatia bacterium]
MKLELLDPFRTFLSQSPFYTSTFITVREWNEPILMMRVAEISLFQQGEFRIQVGFRAWRDRQGTWVVAVPFQIDVSPSLHIQGAPCLNPRHRVDYEVIQKFAQEECLRFIFLSSDLMEADDAQIPWPTTQRAHVRHVLEKIDLTLTDEKLTSVFDPDFEQARRKLTASLATALRGEGEERWQG